MTYRVYVNGVYDRKYLPDCLGNNCKSHNDSCYLFAANEAIPDSSLFIQDIIIRYPADIALSHRYTQASELIERVKDEAGRDHANIVKILEVGMIKRFPYGRYRIRAKLYKLSGDNPGLLRKAGDSLKNMMTDYCIVHLKNYYKTDLTILFNDSLTQTFRRSVSDYYSREIDSVNLRFDKAGILSIRGGDKGIRLEKGNEYFVSIIGTYKYNRPYFIIQSKYDFEDEPRP